MTVTLERRNAWFWRRQLSFQFHEIESITYGYKDASLAKYISLSYDSADWFLVGLKPREKEEIRLFWFSGEGTITDKLNLPAWATWGRLDWAGTQEQESKLFVQLLSKLIGVPIAPSSLTS